MGLCTGCRTAVRFSGAAGRPQASGRGCGKPSGWARPTQADAPPRLHNKPTASLIAFIQVYGAFVLGFQARCAQGKLIRARNPIGLPALDTLDA
jgi:hypothetical protein